MPYIPQARRTSLRPLVRELYQQCHDLGEVNFVITGLITHWWREHGESYSTIALLIGLLETAKMEFYRMVGAHYESKKLSENGDVYSEF